MSKSIYEEVLKELTWLVHDEFNENPKRSRLNVSQRLDMFKKVKDTLEQAQKQEKLLELYKELAMFLTTAVEDGEDTHAYTFANINNLKQQIKELENES